MSPRPTGFVTPGTGDGYDLTLTRSFRASATDVWASLTEPERTARWFGTWRGQGGPGRTVEVQMGFEEGTAWSRVRIDACEPNQRLAVTVVDEAGEWQLEVTLAEHGGVTELRLVHRLADPMVAENTGPGWEYYLDMLVASRDGTPLPDFDDYYPSQAQHFTEAAQEAQRASPAATG